MDIQHRWNEDHKFPGVFDLSLPGKQLGVSRIQRLLFPSIPILIINENFEAISMAE